MKPLWRIKCLSRDLCYRRSTKNTSPNLKLAMALDLPRAGVMEMNQIIQEAFGRER